MKHLKTTILSYNESNNLVDQDDLDMIKDLFQDVADEFFFIVRDPNLPKTAPAYNTYTIEYGYKNFVPNTPKVSILIDIIIGYDNSEMNNRVDKEYYLYDIYERIEKYIDIMLSDFFKRLNTNGYKYDYTGHELRSGIEVKIEIIHETS